MRSIRISGLLLIVIFALATPLVEAGPRRVGNGGDVLLCPSGPIELLDFYEAEVIHRWPIDLGAGPTIEKMMATALHRLERLSPRRAQVYRRQAETFFDEALMLSQVELVDIPDSDHIALPRGCEIRQIANQAEPLLPSGRRYTMDADLWSRLPERDRAGLVLHELVYREALSLGHTNSVAARFLTGLISSRVLESMEIREFHRLLSELGFEGNEVHGVEIRLWDPESGRALEPTYDQDGQVREAFVVPDSWMKVDGDIWHLRDRATFYANGRVQSVVLARVALGNCGWGRCTLAPFGVRFHLNGFLQAATLSEEEDLHSSTTQGRLEGFIEQYDQGGLRRALFRGLSLQPNARPQWLRLEGVTEWDEGGGIRSGTALEPFHYPLGGQQLLWYGRVEFDSGQLKRGQVLNPSRYRWRSVDVVLAPHFVHEFSLGGRPVRLCLADSTELLGPDGVRIRVPARSVVSFSEEGAVTEGTRPSC